jgi:hypothetical protein
MQTKKMLGMIGLKEGQPDCPWVEYVASAGRLQAKTAPKIIFEKNHSFVF